MPAKRGRASEYDPCHTVATKNFVWEVVIGSDGKHHWKKLRPVPKTVGRHKDPYAPVAKKYGQSLDPASRAALARIEQAHSSDRALLDEKKAIAINRVLGRSTIRGDELDIIDAGAYSDDDIDEVYARIERKPRKKKPRTAAQQEATRKMIEARKLALEREKELSRRVYG